MITTDGRKRLWFDVGIKRYTTQAKIVTRHGKLWFDVGIKRYTTRPPVLEKSRGCGLM